MKTPTKNSPSLPENARVRLRIFASKTNHVTLKWASMWCDHCRKGGSKVRFSQERLEALDQVEKLMPFIKRHFKKDYLNEEFEHRLTAVTDTFNASAHVVSEKFLKCLEDASNPAEYPIEDQILAFLRSHIGYVAWGFVEFKNPETQELALVMPTWFALEKYRK